MFTLITLLVLVVVAYCVGYANGKHKMESGAVSAGCGHYSTGTGKFKFGRHPAELACKRVSEESKAKCEELQKMYDSQLDSNQDHLNEVYRELEQEEKKVSALQRQVSALTKGKRK